MKDKNKLIIILCVILIVLVAALFILNRKDIEDQDGSAVQDEAIYEESYSNFVDYVDTTSNYIMVRRVINKYFGYCADYVQSRMEDDKEKVLDMLDSKYKEEFSVTIDNVTDKMPTHLCDSTQINSMYEIRNDGFARMYIAKGVAKNLLNQETSNFQFVVLIDKNTERASILLEDYVIAHQLDQVKYGDKLSPIQNTVENNTPYYYENISDAAFTEDMFYEFKDNLIFYPQLAFDKIASGNASNINSLADLNSYINENRKSLYTMNYHDYLKTNLGNGRYKYKIYTDNDRSFDFIVEKSLSYSVSF